MKYNHAPIRDYLADGLSSLEKYKKDPVGRLLWALSRGCDIEEACRFAKVNRDTYYAWSNGQIPRDSFSTEQEWEQGKSDISDIFNGVREFGKVYIEHEALMNIKTKMVDDWRAAAWLLEHKYPEKYSLKPQFLAARLSSKESSTSLDSTQILKGAWERIKGS